MKPLCLVWTVISLFPFNNNNIVLLYVYFSYSGFGQPQAFNFQQSRTAGSGGVGTDLQTASQIDLSASEFPSLTNRSVPQPSIAPGIRNYGESPVLQP